MIKNKGLVTILIIILILCFVYLIKSSNKLSGEFPPSNVECFNTFMEIANGGVYADGFRIPAFNFPDIEYFRCASSLGFNQYEIRGKDKEGHSFYIHKDEGGMAPSGADGVYNLCYKQDGVTIRNDKLIGRESKKEIGTCSWTNNFPTDPTSSYEYKR